MILAPGLRKLALTAHVVASVGWLGAVVVFLVLAIAGLVSDDPQLVRSSYIAMDLATRAAIIPLGFAALGTGLVKSLGTSWGLCKHYWVLVKLGLTIGGVGLLLLHAGLIAEVADVASATTLTRLDLREARIQLVVDAAAALAILAAAAALSVFKPRGMTRHGWRTQQARHVG